MVWVNYAYDTHCQPIELGYQHSHSHILPSLLRLMQHPLLSATPNCLPSLMLIYILTSLPGNPAILLNCRWFPKVPALIISLSTGLWFGPDSLPSHHAKVSPTFSPISLPGLISHPPAME